MESPSDNKLDLTQRLKYLIQANQSLAAIESYDAIIGRLLDLAKEVTGAEASSFLAYDEKRKVLKCSTANHDVLGERAAVILKDVMVLKLGEGIAGRVAQKRQAINIKDVHKDKYFSKHIDEHTGYVTHNLLGVPVVYGDHLLGVIEVLNAKHKSCFDHTDQEILRSFANLAAVAIIRAHLIEEQLTKHKLQFQMEAASKIQALFWPRVPVIDNGNHLWGTSIPASFTGGDLYDWIQLPDNSWLIYVADVSDKGMPAALLMTALWSRIRSEAMRHHQISQLLKAVNESMFELFADEGHFATIIMVKYDPVSAIMTIATAGHLSPLWISDGQLKTVPLTKGISLGVISEARYKETSLKLAAGEALVLITDGITESLDQQQQFFGQEGIDRFVSQHKGPPWGKGLIKAVGEHARGLEAFDDITVVEIWRDWLGAKPLKPLTVKPSDRQKTDSFGVTFQRKVDRFWIEHRDGFK